jgi:hypothetical protein
MVALGVQRRRLSAWHNPSLGPRRPESEVREGSHTSIDLFDPLRQLCNAQIPALGVDLSRQGQWSDGSNANTACRVEPPENAL